MSEPMSDERLPGIRILLAGANFDRALLAEVDRLRAQVQRVADLLDPKQGMGYSCWGGGGGRHFSDSDIREALDGER